MAGIMFAAIVGGFFSFVSLVSSKEQKVSEFRQEWINGLRDDLSVFFSSARALCRTMQETRSPNTTDDDIQDFKFGKEKIGHMRLAGADALYRIKLRLNKNEPEHKKLQCLLETAIKIQNRINIDKGLDYTDALDAIERASDYSQDILKSEWERVKNGEPTYRYSKYFAIAVLFLGLVVFSLSAYVILNNRLPDAVSENNVTKSIGETSDKQSDEKSNKKINKDNSLNTQKTRVE
jgi:hypothetical protein